jgi:hypothetical protein
MPSDPRDYRLDLTGRQGASDAIAPGAAPHRPFLSVLFNCCRAYVRVYRSADAAYYNARCPKCGKSIRFAVGDGGSPARSFVVE